MATYAGRYNKPLQDRYGNGYRNALVAVETTAGDPITLYADRDKAAYVPASGLAANEIKADSRGNLIFFADPGNYQIVVTPVGGSTLAAFPVSVRPDPLEPDASEGALQAEEDARIAGDTALDSAKVSVTEADLDPALPSRRTLGVRTQQALSGSHAFPHATGAVVLSWDDGYSAWASVLQSRLAERGQHNSFYITTDRIGTPTGASAAEILSLFEDGHEIGAHSVTHPDMRSLTPAQRAVEFDDSKSALEAIIGAGNCVTWAYPYGFRNDASDSEAYLRYDRVVGAGNGWGASLVQRDDRGAFLSPRAAAWNSASHSQVLSMINAAARGPVLACIFGHVPGTDMTVQELEEALDLIDSLGVPTLTSREAFPGQPAAVFNPGFEDGLTDWAQTESPAANGQVMEVVEDAPAPGYPGTHSLRLATANDTSFVYANQTVRMIPGVTHVLSARYRVNIGSGAGYVAMRIQPQDNAGTSLSGTIVTSTQLTSTSWAQATVEVVAGPTAKRARIDFILINRLGEAFFDHVHFGPKADGVLG